MAPDMDVERLFLSILPLAKNALIRLDSEMDTHVYPKTVKTFTLVRARCAFESLVRIVHDAVTLKSRNDKKTDDGNYSTRMST